MPFENAANFSRDVPSFTWRTLAISENVSARARETFRRGPEKCFGAGQRNVSARVKENVSARAKDIRSDPQTRTAPANRVTCPCYHRAVGYTIRVRTAPKLSLPSSFRGFHLVVLIFYSLNGRNPKNYYHTT